MTWSFLSEKRKSTYSKEEWKKIQKLHLEGANTRNFDPLQAHRSGQWADLLKRWRSNASRWPCCSKNRHSNSRYTMLPDTVPARRFVPINLQKCWNCSMISSSGSWAAPRVPGSEAADDADAGYWDEKLLQHSCRWTNWIDSKARSPTMVRYLRRQGGYTGRRLQPGADAGNRYWKEEAGEAVQLRLRSDHIIINLSRIRVRAEICAWGCHDPEVSEWEQ